MVEVVALIVMEHPSVVGIGPEKQGVETLGLMFVVVVVVMWAAERKEKEKV